MIASAVQKRRDEFSTGRVCAKRALQDLGVEVQALLPGEKREPLWPQGLIGSISHSADCCMAAVSQATELLSLGLDVEKREGVSEAVCKLVCVEDELQALGELRHDPEIWKLIFSAKESIYKCLYPLLNQWIGFSQASLRFNFETSKFYAIMDESLGIPTYILNNMQGGFLFSDDYIFTCVEVLKGRIERQSAQNRSAVV